MAWPTWYEIGHRSSLDLDMYPLLWDIRKAGPEEYLMLGLVVHAFVVSTSRTRAHGRRSDTGSTD
jgi:hypothetical protein